MSRYLHAHLRFAFAIVLVLGSLVASVGPAGASPAPQDPAAQYASDSLLVKFKADTPAADKANARAAVQGQLAREYSIVPGLENLRLPVGAIGVEKAIDILSHLPSVEYAEPDYVVFAIKSPDDPYFANGTLWGMNKISAPTAWDTTTGSASVVVADIDTGIDYNHPDLKANVWPDKGWNFITNSPDPYDDNGHGTHTAGTIGAVGNNGIGVVGVNWNVEIMALKFLNRSGSGYTSDAIAALEYAVDKGVKVSNNSWGASGFDKPLCDAIASVADRHLFIAAAGNSSADVDSTDFSPAVCPSANVITVAATDRYDALAYFSNYGATTVDLAAPGVSILSTYPRNRYAYMDGTSMAAPHVAGVAALLWSVNPNLSVAQVKSAILDNVDKVGGLSGKVLTGGRLNAAAAVGSVAPPPSGTPAAPTGLSATAISTSQINLSWADNATNETGYYVERCQGATCSNFTQIDVLGANATSYNNTGLTANTTYNYRVRAYNASGNSGYSNTAGATTQAATGNTMHLAGLTGLSIVQTSTKWKAQVAATVHDGNDGALAGVTVNGTWSDGATGTASCVTGTDGKCAITKVNLKTASVKFTVTSLVLSGYTATTAEVPNYVVISKP